MSTCLSQGGSHYLVARPGGRAVGSTTGSKSGPEKLRAAERFCLSFGFCKAVAALRAAGAGADGGSDQWETGPLLRGLRCTRPMAQNESIASPLTFTVDVRTERRERLHFDCCFNACCGVFLFSLLDTIKFVKWDVFVQTSSNELGAGTIRFSADIV